MLEKKRILESYEYKLKQRIKEIGLGRAFGDEKCLKYQRKIFFYKDAINEIMKTHELCKSCDDGMVEHDCSCDQCEVDEEPCYTCSGEGVVLK